IGNCFKPESKVEERTVLSRRVFCRRRKIVAGGHRYGEYVKHFVVFDTLEGENEKKVLWNTGGEEMVFSLIDTTTLLNFSYRCRRLDVVEIESGLLKASRSINFPVCGFPIIVGDWICFQEKDSIAMVKKDLSGEVVRKNYISTVCVSGKTEVGEKLVLLYAYTSFESLIMVWDIGEMKIVSCIGIPFIFPFGALMKKIDEETVVLISSTHPVMTVNIVSGRVTYSEKFCGEFCRADVFPGGLSSKIFIGK